ncbi:MAG: hypothetical protein ACYC26_17450 [Phycisphaerales bacterium]
MRERRERLFRGQSPASTSTGNIARALQYACAVNANSLNRVTARHATLPDKICNANNRNTTHGGSNRSRHRPRPCPAASHAWSTNASLSCEDKSSLTRRTAAVIPAILGLL